MTTLVHIADARLAARTTRAGPTPGKTTRVVCFMLASGQASGDDELIEQVAVTLAYFRHPNARSMLPRLREHGTAVVGETAAERLAELYGT